MENKYNMTQEQNIFLAKRNLVDNDKYMFLYHAASKEGKPAFRIVASSSYRNNQICTATPQPWKSCILFS